MKTIKKISILLLLLMLPVTIVMCSDDDSGSGTKVTYKVNAGDDIITAIGYKNAAGVMVNINDEDDDYSKTIRVKPPFTATMMVTFNNTTNVASNYSLMIYADGELVDIDEGTIAPMSGNFISTVSYTIE